MLPKFLPADGYTVKENNRVQFTKNFIKSRDEAVYSVSCTTHQYIWKISFQVFRKKILKINKFRLFFQFIFSNFKNKYQYFTSEVLYISLTQTRKKKENHTWDSNSGPLPHNHPSTLLSHWDSDFKILKFNAQTLKSYISAMKKNIKINFFGIMYIIFRKIFCWLAIFLKIRNLRSYWQNKYRVRSFSLTIWKLGNNWTHKKFWNLRGLNPGPLPHSYPSTLLSH